MKRKANEKGPLRIVHVTLGLDMGGQEKLLVEFARHADRERFELRIVSLGGRGCLAEEIENCGWPVTTMDQPFGLRPGLVFRLARLIRLWKADVVHTHDDRPLIYAALAARVCRVPQVIHTRHHAQGQKFTPRQNQVMALAGRMTDRFVCVSEDSTRMTLRQGIPSDRVVRIWNGIDTRRFAFAGPCIDGPIVTVARLSPEKDIGTLVRAAAIAIRYKPSFRLEIAGDGVCLAALKELVVELGLKEHVRFLGQVNDVLALLERAGLFVLPSLNEGISLTLLEAMAKGLPVVATRVGGNPEVVEEGETGLLVPAQDPESLARAMLWMQNNPQESSRMGCAGRRRVEQHFDVRRMVAAYEALYEGPGKGRRDCKQMKVLSAPTPALARG